MMVQYGSNWSLQEHFYNVVAANADMDASGTIDLGDVGILADFYWASRPYDPRADFDHNNSIGLEDIGFFASHSGHACP